MYSFPGLRHLHLFLFFLFSVGGLVGQGLTFDPPAGEYATAREVRISGGGAGAIFYTLDGRTPSPDSRAYRGEPIPIATSTVLRAAVFVAGQARAITYGATYLIDEPATELMTVSVGVDPWRLFDRRHGWFEAGPDSAAANWWTDAEHPVHVDLLETDGRAVHSGTLGLRLFGGVSRKHPQKSFSLSGRRAYGKHRIDYPVFGAGAPDDFRFLVVRNAGSDWGRSYLRDPLLTGLLQDESWDTDRQAARPVRVYLNGRYWGLYHLREKINPRFLEDHHGVDKDALTLMEHERTLKHGRDTSYGSLLDFVATHDLARPEHFAALGERMDIDNFQRLQIAQTYFDNRDAGGNIRYWRPDAPGGRWRWILYDVDQGFGLHRYEGWKINTLLASTEARGPVWPNPPWSTLLQRRLLTNPDYRRSFVNRSLDYLHTDFSAEAVLERTDAAIEGIATEMPRQLARWRGRADHWAYHCDQLRQYARYRPAALREHLREYFGAGEDRRVDLSATVGGYVELNDNLHVGSDGLSGDYFVGFPPRLRAVAEPGYRFTGWTGVDTEEPTLDLDLSSDRPYMITATFEAFDHPLAGRIVFTELCPLDRAAGDWIELYNRTDSAVSLTDWYLVDGGGSPLPSAGGKPCGRGVSGRYR